MSRSKQPLYKTIYNHLVEKIITGAYAAGERIPSEKELAEEFKVSRITSKKALEMLAEKGYINRMPGRGSYVLGHAENREAHKERVSPPAKRRNLIGVIMPDFSESYGLGLISGMEREAAKENLYMILKRSNDRQDMEERIIDELIHLGVDGIIIMPVHGEHYNHKILRLVLDGFPIVSVDRYLNGIPVPFVGTDNINASKKATDYLIDLGHTSIAILSPPYKNTSAIEDRFEGYIQSHLEHGIVTNHSLWLTELMSTVPGNYSHEAVTADVEKIVDFLQHNPQVTCLYAIEYNIALLAVKAAKRLGRKIPEELSILCFDSPNSYNEEYFFTYIRQRETEMGESAMRLLLEKRKGKCADKIFLDADLVFGTTTASSKRV